MPTYQYACTACGHQLEAVQSFTDAALTDCPVCEGRLRKLFSAVGIVFKGSGFYRTDSRSGSADSTGTKDGKAGKETTTTGASSTASPSSESGTSASGSGSGSESTTSSNGATSKGSTVASAA